MRSRSFLSRPILAFLLFWGLNASLSAQELKENPRLDLVTIHLGDKRIGVEVARTPRELSQGLMFRERIPDNEGMLFCLPQEERAAFWMKNVRIPLSVAYIDRQGVILEIWDMKPFDTATTKSQSDRVYYALEMNQGWFQLNQVRVGECLKIEGRSLESLRKTGKSD